jgi:hypothetical protein
MPFTFNLELDHGRIFKRLGLMPEHMDGQIAASATPFICHAIAPLFKFPSEIFK